MSKHSIIFKLGEAYKKWLSTLDNNYLEDEVHCAIWNKYYNGDDEKKKLTTGKLPKGIKKSRITKLSNKRAGSARKSLGKKGMEMYALPEDSRYRIKGSYNKPLLVKSTKKRKMGRGQSRRSLLDAMPRKVGERKTK